MLNTTLCYLERGDQYLMLHRVKKKNDLNHDKWIGVGGKFLEGETPEECILRETREETGLTLTGWRYRGLVTFLSDTWEGEYMHLFTAHSWTGKQTVCDEGDLAWIEKSRLRELPLWQGDRIFLDLLETNAPFFSLKLRYEGERLAEAALDGRPLPADLSLEPLTAAHREGLAALWGDERVIRYTAIAAPCGAAETEARLAQYLAAQAALPRPTVFAVTLDGRFCGAAGCLKTERENTFGLFYQLLPEVWGRGIGTLSARMALAALLRQRPQALVLADAAAENPASVRILKRLGFERTGVRRERGMEICGFQLAPDGGLRA